MSDLQQIATKLRIDSIKATQASNSGHPTSCSSIAELVSTLFFNEMAYFPMSPMHPLNDRFVLSKGHAAPILYAAYAMTGLYSENELLNLRKITSDFEGHPTPRLNFVDVATGSLGQGLSIAVGMAYCGKFIDKLPYRVYCIMGDGESFEGSVWEAMALASIYRLDNLVAIIDVNRLGQSEATPFGHDVETYKKKGEAFGWHSIIVDGHNLKEIKNAFKVARETPSKPTLIVAKTMKGYEFSGISNELNWHGKPLGGKTEEVLTYLSSQLKGDKFATKVKEPEMIDFPKCDQMVVNFATPLPYKSGDKVSTREAYGNALQRIGEHCSRVIGLDADTKNSTFSIKLKNKKPDQFMECFIGEQNMIGVGIGLACRNRCIPFCSTFAAFFTRGFDQIRMGAVSQTNCNFAGSHCGVSIGEDGPSQMALEDLAMFRAIPHCTVFYPSDAISCENAVRLSANTKNICYIRTSRPNTSLLYDVGESFEIGKCKIVHPGVEGENRAVVIGAGITLHEALKAAKLLKEKHSTNVMVIDLFTVKPIDKETICEKVRSTNGNVITVEDHYPEGGIAEAVRTALNNLTDLNINFKSLCVRDVPRSGKSDELLDMFKINAKAIVESVLSIKM